MTDEKTLNMKVNRKYFNYAVKLYGMWWISSEVPSNIQATDKCAGNQELISSVFESSPQILTDENIVCNYMVDLNSAFGMSALLRMRQQPALSQYIYRVKLMSVVDAYAASPRYAFNVSIPKMIIIMSRLPNINFT